MSNLSSQQDRNPSTLPPAKRRGFVFSPWLVSSGALVTLMMIAGFSWWRRLIGLDQPEPIPVEQKEVVQQPPQPPSPPTPPPPTQASSPAWLKTIKHLDFDVAVDEQSIHPTFFIGLGPTSLPVLEQIAQNLSSVKENPQMSSVQFLHIDVQPGSSSEVETQPSHLTSSQRVILRPDLAQYNDRLSTDPEENYYLNWWRHSRAGEASQDYDRAAARLGLFDDFQTGITNSKLWAKLGKGVQQLDTSVWIIASTADWAGSSLAFDIAHLVRQTAGSKAGVSTTSLVLMLQNIEASEGISRFETKEWRAARTFASFQELARFSRNQSVHFRYNPMAVHQEMLDTTSSSARLIDDAYVVDAGFKLGAAKPPDQNIHEAPSTHASSRHAISSLADTLTGMVFSPVHTAVQDKLNSIRPKAANSYQGQNEKTHVMSMSSVSYHIPFSHLYNYIGYRLAYEALTNKTPPLYGLCAEMTQSLPNLPEAVRKWLRGEGDLAPKHPLWHHVADLSENKSSSMKTVISANASQWFQVKLLEKVTALLNGTDLELKITGGRLNIAIRFCRDLSGLIRKTMARLPIETQKTAKECQLWAMKLAKHLDEWDLEMSTQIRQLEKDVKQAHTQLIHEFAIPNHWTPAEIRQIDQFYKAVVRHEDDLDRDMLNIVVKRMGWMAQDGLKPLLSVGLVRIGDDHTKPVWYEVVEGKRLKESLLQLTHRMAKQINGPLPVDLLNSDEALRRRVADWLVAKSGDAGGAVTIRGALGELQNQIFLLSHDKLLSRSLADDVTAGATAPPPFPLEGGQPESCTLMRVVGPIDLNTVEAYKDAQKAFRQASQKMLLLGFEIEQIQVACRQRLGGDGRLSPQIVTALADIQLAQLFVSLVTRGLIYQSGVKGEIVLQLTDRDRPIVLDSKGDWVLALTALTHGSAIELSRELNAETRVGFVKQLQSMVRKQDSQNYDVVQKSRRDFEMQVERWLASPPDSNLWQLGVVMEYLSERG